MPLIGGNREHWVSDYINHGHDERQAITVLATDENGQAVYVAGLAYTGTWLIR